MRPIAKSKITQRHQTTVPRAILETLSVKAGDTLEYVVEDGHVILRASTDQNAADDPFRLFDEWDSEVDDQAFAHLQKP